MTPVEDITSPTLSSPVSELPNETLNATDNDVPQSSLAQMDVGTIYSKTESPADFSTTMHSLTVVEKYGLLTNHKLPSKDHTFSTQYLGGCNHSFQPSWLSQHTWMVYSQQVDGVC